MVTTRPPKTIVKPTALGPVANTDTKLLIYGLFQKGRVLAQDGVAGGVPDTPVEDICTAYPNANWWAQWPHSQTTPSPSPSRMNG